MSLALSTVIYEWPRYVAAMVALAFSGLLVLAQVGLFVGLARSATASIDRAPVELMVLAQRAESLINSGGSGLPRRVMPLVYKHPEVVALADISGNDGRWSNLDDSQKNGTAPQKTGADAPKKKRTWVEVMSVDTGPDSLTMPTDFGESTRLALEQPYAVAVDQTALAQLGVKLGDKAALNGHEVVVGAVLHGYPSLGGGTTIYASRQTMRLLGMAPSSDRVGPLQVRIAHPAKAEQVRDELNRMSNGQYRAWTKPELSKANEQAILKEQIIGLFLSFSVVLGVFIGVAITSQTLRGAILANIRELASLRALGVSMGSLRLIVLEISWWVGVAGLAVTAILVWGVSLLAAAGNVPMAFPMSNIIATALFLLGIAMMSGLMALGILKKSQPADLLR
jgi:putative ABC transport system permease protein